MTNTKQPPTNEGKKFRIEPLDPDEVQRLIRAIPARSSSGLRLRALVAVMYGAGLRLQEALDLVPRDIDPDACSLTVHRGKGDKRRVAGIDPGSLALLTAWMERRAQLGLNGRHPVFATYSANSHGAPLIQRYVRAALARATARAGLDKRVHPHGLRHSHAVALQEDGLSLPVIQRQLGHASLDGTAHYLARLTNDDVVALVRNRPDWTEGL